MLLLLFRRYYPKPEMSRTQHMRKQWQSFYFLSELLLLYGFAMPNRTPEPPQKWSRKYSNELKLNTQWHHLLSWSVLSGNMLELLRRHTGVIMPVTARGIASLTVTTLHPSIMQMYVCAETAKAAGALMPMRSRWLTSWHYCWMHKCV